MSQPIKGTRACKDDCGFLRRRWDESHVWRDQTSGRNIEGFSLNSNLIHCFGCILEITSVLNPQFIRYYLTRLRSYARRFTSAWSARTQTISAVLETPKGSLIHTPGRTHNPGRTHQVSKVCSPWSIGQNSGRAGSGQVSRAGRVYTAANYPFFGVGRAPCGARRQAPGSMSKSRPSNLMNDNINEDSEWPYCARPARDSTRAFKDSCRAGRAGAMRRSAPSPGGTGRMPSDEPLPQLAAQPLKLSLNIITNY